MKSKKRVFLTLAVAAALIASSSQAAHAYNEFQFVLHEYLSTSDRPVSTTANHIGAKGFLYADQSPQFINLVILQGSGVALSGTAQGGSYFTLMAATTKTNSRIQCYWSTIGSAPGGNYVSCWRRSV